LNWAPLETSAAGLDLAATCRIEEVERFKGPPEWTAAPLLPECSHSLLMSFKIAHEAIVGGNICMSLPAGAMISLTTSLEAVYTLWPRAGVPRKVPAIDFVPWTSARFSWWLDPGHAHRRTIDIIRTALVSALCLVLVIAFWWLL
jgi:hypothetical protein